MMQSFPVKKIATKQAKNYTRWTNGGLMDKFLMKRMNHFKWTIESDGLTNGRTDELINELKKKKTTER